METDMNTNANKKKYDAKADETAIFRVLALIFAAIVGFGALSLLDTYKSKLFSYIMNGDKPVITVMTIVISVFALIAALSVAYFVYCRKKKTDESRRAVTSFGIMFSALFVLVSLLLVRFLTNAMIKVEVLFFATVILAFIYNICPKSFFGFSLFSAVSGAALYYIGSGNTNYGLDKAFQIISYVYAFAAPIVVVVLAILGSRKGKSALFAKDGGDMKFYNIFRLIMAALLLVFAIVCMLANFMAVYLIAAYFVIYLVLGIFCTIKMM